MHRLVHNLAFLLTDNKSVNFSCHSKFVGHELEVFYTVCNKSTTTCAKKFTYNLLLQCCRGLQSARVKELARCSKFNKYSWHHVSSGIINHYYKEQSKTTGRAKIYLCLTPFAITNGSNRVPATASIQHTIVQMTDNFTNFSGHPGV